MSSEAKRECFASLCEQITARDSKLRWALLKRVQPSTLTPLTSIPDPASGALPSSHEESLDHLCSAFIRNGTPDPPATATLQAALVRQRQQVDSWASPAQPTIPPHASDAWVFTLAEVQEQCTRQHTSTAPGPDALLPTFLRYAGHAVWSALAAMYTFSWRHSVTPQAWREANVIALYKGSGSKAAASSYRPISMTSILIRTLEHLIHRRLVHELEGRNYLADYQFGFRARHSTNDAIHFLLTSIQGVLRHEGAAGDDARQCPVLFLDIQKAFDRVDHAILLHRVRDAGITGKAWLWLRSFLSDRRMRCVDASEHSAWQRVEYGVPQGCVLSPLLFLIFINQLQLDILADPQCRHVAPVFYADDGTIGPNPFDPCPPTAARFEAEYLQHLQAAMRHLERWCDESRMRFGADKSRLVVFTRRQTVNEAPYANLRLCGFTVGTATEYEYLGLHLTQRLTWNRAFDHGLQQARRTSAIVTRVALRARTLTSAAVRSLVLGYVIPSFSYALLFWGRATDLSAAQVTALQAQLATPLRVALSLPRTTHQLGSLLLSHVPTVAALVVKAQLSHLARVTSPTALPPTHPTRRLHTASIHHIEQIPVLRPWTALAPAAALTLSVYLTACAVPRLLHEPALGGRLDPVTHAALLPVPCPNHERGVEYWEHKGKERREWAKTHYSGDDLLAAIHCSLQAGPLLDRPTIGKLAAFHSHAEWVATHAPANPAPGYVPAPHTTSAPLTLCLPTPDPAPLPPPPLHRLPRPAGAPRPPGPGQVPHWRRPPALRQERGGSGHQPSLHPLLHRRTARRRDHPTHAACVHPPHIRPRPAVGQAPTPGRPPAPVSRHHPRHHPPSPAVPRQPTPPPPPRHLLLPVRGPQGPRARAASPPRHGLIHPRRGRSMRLPRCAETATHHRMPVHNNPVPATHPDSYPPPLSPNPPATVPTPPNSLP